MQEETDENVNENLPLFSLLQDFVPKMTRAQK